ncbi:hypothetical protein ACJX0J_031111, partial [Zea mays]
PQPLLAQNGLFMTIIGDPVGVAEGNIYVIASLLTLFQEGIGGFLGRKKIMLGTKKKRIFIAKFVAVSEYFDCIWSQITNPLLLEDAAFMTTLCCLIFLKLLTLVENFLQPIAGHQNMNMISFYADDVTGRLKEWAMPCLMFQDIYFHAIFFSGHNLDANCIAHMKPWNFF